MTSLVVRHEIVSIDRLIPMEDMRLQQDAMKDEELLNSIIEYGVRDELLCRPHPDSALRVQDKLQVVDGRRRRFLSLKAGLTSLPVEIREMDDLEAYTMAMIKNIQRADVDDVGIAHWLNLMQIKFKLSQEELAKKLSRSQSWISRHLSLWREVVEAQKSMMPRPETERQARALRAMSDEVKQGILNKSGQVLPPAREMERRSGIKIPAEELLNKYDPFKTDQEFIIFKLQDESGLTLTEAKDATSKWQKTLTAHRRVFKGWEPPPSNPMVQLYSELSKYYPTEVIDFISRAAPARSLQTWISNCRRFYEKLFSRTPMELRQAVLEEFKI